MRFTRRQFILSTTTILASGVALPKFVGAAQETGKASKPLRILILGGTGFLDRTALNRQSRADTRSLISIAAGPKSFGKTRGAPRLFQTASKNFLAIAIRTRRLMIAGLKARRRCRRIPTALKAFRNSKGKGGMRSSTRAASFREW